MYTHVHMYSCIHTTQICIYTYIRTPVCAHICTYRVYIHTCVYGKMETTCKPSKGRPGQFLLCVYEKKNNKTPVYMSKDKL